MLTSRPSWKNHRLTWFAEDLYLSIVMTSQNMILEYNFKYEVQKMNELSSATEMSPPRIESCQSQHWYKLVSNTEPFFIHYPPKTSDSRITVLHRRDVILSRRIPWLLEEELITRDRKSANAGLRFGQFESITRHTWLSFFFSKALEKQMTS